MKFVQVFFKFSLIILTCETALTEYLANQSQKDLIEQSMDFSANPCEDFYQYACGKWLNFNNEAGEKYNETISLLDYKANKEMADVFDAINLKNQPNYVKKAYDFYKSCIDVEEYKSVHYLNWLTIHENLKFPTIWRSRSTREKFEWPKTLAALRIYGLNGIFIEEHVVQSGVNSSKFIIELAKPDASGGFPVLTRDNLVEIVKSLGMPIKLTNIEKLWLEVQEFELNLKNYDFYIDEDLQFKTVKDLPLPWLKDYIQILLNQTELSPNMKIHLKNIPYFMALDELVKQQSQRFLCKYIEIRFLWHLLQQGHTNLTSENCISYVRGSLTMAMNWLYEQQHTNLQQEFPKITELYDDIKNHLSEMIQKTDDRVNILAKIDNMQLKLNNIPRKNTVRTLEIFYENVDLKDDDFYVNHLNLMKFNFKVEHNFHSENIQQQDFISIESSNFAATSAPNLHRISNTVVVPLTLLQPPIYQPGSTLSTLGFLLAREMFHSFDNDYLDFTNPLFTDSFECLLKYNPTETNNQIADISGLRYAYQIFNDTRTDVMDDLSNKLFFVNFAQIFCGASDSDEFERISDILMHFPQFLQVFQCNSSHLMYPNGECDDVPPVADSN